MHASIPVYVLSVLLCLTISPSGHAINGVAPLLPNDRTLIHSSRLGIRARYTDLDDQQQKLEQCGALRSVKVPFGATQVAVRVVMPSPPQA